MALSPLDGRYRDDLDTLSEMFSEFALINSRWRVELDFLLAIDRAGLFPKLTQAERKKISSLKSSFSLAHAEQVWIRDAVELGQ